jgi:hypothetical protein
MRDVILVDLDHTLADSYWRDCLMPLIHETGDWTTYYSCQRADKPFAEWIEFVRSLAADYDVWIITARQEGYRDDTEWWLDEYNVPRVGVLMRPKGDLRGSPELKFALVEPLLSRVRLLIDDRDDVLDYFVANGICVLKSGRRDERVDHDHINCYRLGNIAGARLYLGIFGGNEAKEKDRK